MKWARRSGGDRRALKVRPEGGGEGRDFDFTTGTAQRREEVGAARSVDDPYMPPIAALHNADLLLTCHAYLLGGFYRTKPFRIAGIMNFC